MSNNKEDSQLLPFHKSNNRSRAEDLDDQDDLKQLLRKLPLGDPSEKLADRILSSYTEQVERRPIWKRVLRGTIPLPIPIAAMIALSIVPLAYLALRPSGIVIMESHMPASEKVRIVEVPIVQERIVTRTVYVNRPSANHDNAAEKRDSVADKNFDEFTPVDELKIRLIKGSEQHE